jgi:hypothetical protein
MSTFPQSSQLVTSEPDAAEVRRALICGAITIAVAVGFAFAPPRDASKVVAGVPCSVISESQVGEALGMPARLLPTGGTVCQYVATDARAQRSLFVVAHRDDEPANVSGTNNSLSVRSGSHTYTVTIVQPATDAATIHAEEVRVARMMPGAMIAAR